MATTRKIVKRKKTVPIPTSVVEETPIPEPIVEEVPIPTPVVEKVPVSEIPESVVEDKLEIKEEVSIEVKAPEKEKNNQDEELIKSLKEKLENGTITDGEAAEYRMLISK